MEEKREFEGGGARRPGEEKEFKPGGKEFKPGEKEFTPGEK